MKHFKILLLPILFFLISFAGIAQRGGGGWSAKNNYNRLFNPESIMQLKGTITSIEKIIPLAGMSNGIHLMIKTKKNDLYSVHLGPQWYIDDQSIQLSVGDVVVVNGSRITYKKAPAIIAVSIQKGKNILILRDKNGFPNWSGSKKNIKAGAIRNNQ